MSAMLRSAVVSLFKRISSSTRVRLSVLSSRRDIESLISYVLCEQDGPLNGKMPKTERRLQWI